MIVKLQNVRIAFCQNLYTPGAMAGDDPSKKAYSSSFLLAKDDPQLKTVRAVIQAVANEKWGNQAAAVMKVLEGKDAVCLHDGDMKSQYDGFEGTMYISARSKTAPKVFDRDRTILTAETGKPYAGCYVVVSLDIWAQDNNYGKRVNATLRGVQFMRDGDAFAGSAPATAEDFDDLSDQGEADGLISVIRVRPTA